MSFVVNGITWTSKTAATHAQTQLDAINALRSSRGESLLIATPDNAIWLELLAAGSLQQNYDNELYGASQSFNVATCSDDQVLNLLPISGTQLIPATYSTVNISVTAAAAGAATVPQGTLAPFSGINFVVNLTTVVPAGTTVSIPATADTPGPYLALTGNISSFYTSIPNVQTVTNLAASTQGAVTETVNALRKRLINGTSTINWSLDGTILAIQALQGITHANVYFNPDTISNLVLQGGTTILPRNCRIVIQGTDVTGQLANTYASRQTSPTQGAFSENWITKSGQNIPIFYDVATNQPVYIKVYYDPALPVSSGFNVLLQAAIVALGANLSIGQSVSSQFISEGILGFPYCTVTGVTVSADNITFSREALVNATSVGQILTANVSVLSGP
jgi:hypothetical protein